ncbi:hypothetical protein ACU5CE_33450 [Priestia megaterium]|uniref:hypothetical protein n=1 Tax=Priestia megaterium TaxID=1404 RepID=UPI00406BA8E5
MKDVFSYNIDIEKNAYMNWRTHRHDHRLNMITLADGFSSSSITLAKQALSDNHDKKADILIYPILFNANHAIEVYLKAISWSLNILTKTNKEFIKNHSLIDLLNDVKKLVGQFENNTETISYFNEMINPLEKYLDELYSKIETLKSDGKKRYNIDFSRYTLDIKGEPQFYINEFDNVVIDLENFCERFKTIFENLSTTARHYLYDFEEE